MSEAPREQLGLLVIRVRLERDGGRLIARITCTPDVDDLPAVTTVAGSPAEIERAVREWLDTLVHPGSPGPPTTSEKGTTLGPGEASADPAGP
jgi:hypothetical protein